MIAALFKAFGQLTDPRTRRLLLWVFLLSLAVAAALIGAAVGVLSALSLAGIGWLDDLIAALGGLAAAFLAWVMFPAVALMIAYAFTDPVAEAVEARHYPRLPPARPQSLWQFVRAGVRFELVSLLLNILLLPLAIIPFVQTIYPAAFYTVNGYLFGREFLEIVAPRRMDFRATRALFRRHPVKLFVAGLIIVFLFTAPVLNLLAPVLATAFMVHVYHGIVAGERRGTEC